MKTLSLAQRRTTAQENWSDLKVKSMWRLRSVGARLGISSNGLKRKESYQGNSKSSRWNFLMVLAPMESYKRFWSLTKALNTLSYHVKLMKRRLSPAKGSSISPVAPMTRLTYNSLAAWLADRLIQSWSVRLFRVRRRLGSRSGSAWIALQPSSWNRVSGSSILKSRVESFLTDLGKYHWVPRRTRREHSLRMYTRCQLTASLCTFFMGLSASFSKGKKLADTGRRKNLNCSWLHWRKKWRCLSRICLTRKKLEVVKGWKARRQVRLLLTNLFWRIIKRRQKRRRKKKSLR